MLITLNSCSAAGQGFYIIFVQAARVFVCLSNLMHEANFIIKYLRVLHSISGEMCERFYIFYHIEAKKTIGSLR